MYIHKSDSFYYYRKYVYMLRLFYLQLHTYIQYNLLSSTIQNAETPLTSSQTSTQTPHPQLASLFFLTLLSISPSIIIRKRFHIISLSRRNSPLLLLQSVLTLLLVITLTNLILKAMKI